MFIRHPSPPTLPHPPPTPHSPTSPPGFSWASYLAHQLYLDLLCSRGQDLKKKYKAQWALVTGASSGIGKALAWECARQGLNVVMVALPDKMFDAVRWGVGRVGGVVDGGSGSGGGWVVDGGGCSGMRGVGSGSGQRFNTLPCPLTPPLSHTHHSHPHTPSHPPQTFRDIQSAFPSLSFRKVPVNLGKHGDYMPAIADATDDIDVQVVFNNAGYMKWGFFVKTAVGDQMANLEVSGSVFMMNNEHEMGCCSSSPSHTIHSLPPTQHHSL